VTTRARAARASLRTLASTALTLVLGAEGAGAQVSPPASAAARPAGGVISLQLRPKPGEVFRMRLDQDVEVTATARQGDGDTTMTVRTNLQVLTRSYVERSDAQGAIVLAITDSVLIFTTGVAGDWIDQTMRRLKGQRLRTRLAPDGGMTLLDDGGDPQLRALVASMPAMLPRDPVAPGATWTHTMRIPLAGEPGTALGGELTASFRFDSLGRSGELAYISMKGVIRQRTDAEDVHGLHADVSGTMTGAIMVDRRRGWIVDVRTTMQARSTLVPAGGSGEPMRFRMKVQQRLRAM
jgi:hypothetical protein